MLRQETSFYESQIPAHWIVLRLGSPKLYAQLKELESQEHAPPKIPVVLEDSYTTPDDVECLLEFLYTQQCTIKTHRLMALLQLSHSYEVCPAFEHCLCFIAVGSPCSTTWQCMINIHTLSLTLLGRWH